ncbi:hypothetical protein [Rubripirellula tenax]|nr:hypothetical protein [Rubripirellula tenax]
MLDSLYQANENEWTGCHWQTEFGPRHLNLSRVRSHQARWMAEATSGEESNDWEEATRFLTQVETDSQTARCAAKRAVAMAKSGEFCTAMAEAQIAVDLEKQYPKTSHWKKLLDAIAAMKSNKF